AVMLVLARLAAPLGRGLWLLGLVCIVLPLVWRHAVFNGTWLNWVGLVTKKPVTEDYVPVLPWLGVLLWGQAAGREGLARAPGLLMGALPTPARPLALLGQWSLSFYMLHQPLFIGALMAWMALRR
ncbi:MAG: DUF1624 domain-containing protein, partial [Burkholderiaceae bacterium]|nr:DUF1624 domain-containing protein [Burkholderiaceae bacterium]